MTKRPTGRKLKARLFVVSAPSGCGKTTLCKKLLKDGLGLVPSVSVTTRKPRPGEKNGRDYVFVSKPRFLRMLKKREFLEHEDNFGNLYGTLRAPVEDNIKRDRSVLLSIDVKGAMKVKRAYPARSVLIFVLPPSVGELKKRLVTRRSDDPKAIKTRLSIAKREISFKSRYDHRIINDRLRDAYRKLKNIVKDQTQGTR